jgi:hypothetical protein
MGKERRGEEAEQGEEETSEWKTVEGKMMKIRRKMATKKRKG